MIWPDGVTVRPGERLARHAPWRVGGPCDAWILVDRREALPEVFTACREAGWSRTVLGAGTRVVVRDGGLAGAVIRLGEGFVGVEEEGDTVRVGAATPVALVAKALQWPSKRFAPGTLGGSLVCDEGWAPWVVSVRVVGRGAEKEVAWADVGPLASVAIVEARLRRLDVPPPALRRSAAWMVAPEGEDAAVALREASLAGTRLRAILAPEAAPELLVNLGGGDARDLQLLQRSLVERVLAARGIQLVDRMQWMGRPS